MHGEYHFTHIIYYDACTSTTRLFACFSERIPSWRISQVEHDGNIQQSSSLVFIYNPVPAKEQAAVLHYKWPTVDQLMGPDDAYESRKVGFTDRLLPRYCFRFSITKEGFQAGRPFPYINWEDFRIMMMMMTAATMGWGREWETPKECPEKKSGVKSRLTQSDLECRILGSSERKLAQRHFYTRVQNRAFHTFYMLLLFLLYIIVIALEFF